MTKFLNSKWAVFCLLVVIVLAVFGRAIWFDYVQFDEGIPLINNRFFISDISNFLEVFKHDINYPSAVAPYYRPIFILSFMLNSQLGSSPLAYHLGNILFHILVVIMLFWFLSELGVKKSVSILSSVLFAVHPAVIPVVVWIPGRTEAILAIFVLLSLVFFIKFLKTAHWYYLIGVFLSFGIAIFTKETTVALLPILFFYYLMHRNEKGSEMLVTVSSGLVLIIVAWFFIRKSIITQINDLSFFEMLNVLWSNSSAAILYLGKTLLPFNLTGLPVLENSLFIYGFITLTVLVLYWIFAKIKLISLGTLGLIWFVALLAPSLVSYNMPDNMIFFEYRLYLPLMGILIFFASSDLIQKLDFKKLKVLVPGLVVIVLFSSLSFIYSSAYKDKMSFWQKAVADSPSSSDAHNGLATAYLMDGKLEEAEAEFIKTTEINPKEKRVHLLLGLYYLDQEIYDKAKTEFEKEIEIDPKSFVAYHSLGRIYGQNKNLKEAEVNFLKAFEINPDYILVHQDLAVLYFVQNKHPQAIAHIKELLKRQTAETLHPQILKIIEIYAKETALQKSL